MRNGRPSFAMGDVHGQLEKLAYHLLHAGLINLDLSWTGGDARLWFVGDFFDRGPHGLRTIDLIMRWQEEAQRDGGEVGGLLGNHEILLLAAYVFGCGPEPDALGFKQNWEANGGNLDDLRDLTETHVEWISDLPSVVLVGDRLLQHADSRFYLSYGRTTDEINLSIRRVLHSRGAEDWATLIEAFCSRHEFDDTWPGGRMRAIETLEALGGRQIIHGHTPIDKVLKKKARDVREPLVYAGGLVVNIDGGMYRGGPGFLYRLAENRAGVVRD